MCNILNKEFAKPTEISTKARWRYTYECSKCNKIDSKYYSKKNWSCLCAYCKRGGLSTEEFISKSKSIYDDRFDYSKTIYTGHKRKLTLSCKTHGYFTVRPSDHLCMDHGGGCKGCAVDNRVQVCTLSLDVWKDRLKSHPHLLIVKYDLLGYHHKVTLLCSKHGEFETEFGAISKAKSICPGCAKLNHQPQSIRPNLIGTNAELYFIYLPEIDMYKLGVTCNSLNQRLAGSKGFKLLQSWTYEYTKAVTLEHELHSLLVDFRYAGTKLIKIGGSTELYKMNVLSQINKFLRASLGRPNVENCLNEEHLEEDNLVAKRLSSIKPN